jgi:hypothetical protein
LAAINLYLGRSLEIANELSQTFGGLVAGITPISPEQIASIKSNLTEFGLPTIEADILRRGGYSEAEINEIASVMSSADDSFFFSYNMLPENAQAVTSAINATINTIPDPPPGFILANINVDPDTISSKSSGRYITCYLSLPAAFDPKQIDLSSILLNDTHHIEPHPFDIRDYNNDGIQELMVKFNQQKVARELTIGKNTMVISGKLLNELTFEGIDIITRQK